MMTEDRLSGLCLINVYHKVCIMDQIDHIILILLPILKIDDLNLCCKNCCFLFVIRFCKIITWSPPNQGTGVIHVSTIDAYTNTTSHIFVPYSIFSCHFTHSSKHFNFHNIHTLFYSLVKYSTVMFLKKIIARDYVSLKLLKIVLYCIYTNNNIK
jgi:hypothetical protein